jgi:hypothetical protein
MPFHPNRPEIWQARRPPYFASPPRFGSGVKMRTEEETFLAKTEFL